ncbi:MAG: hypothetical protein A2Y66_05555 [Nitrospirae bacterium RBG_13_41_22]|nr:MAG: hypothetical protein A2Y66_05555 [Nitrospirae bacterium RBG_13_41_22]
MKRLCLLILLALMIPAFANAKETMILYDQFQIPSSYGGQQISKSYYIKESLTRVDPKNPNLLQVKTYRKVTNREGIIEYRVTFQINCENRRYTIFRHWSTGFGEDTGLMVDGTWSPVSDYEDMVALIKLICPKK